jgi:glyoxylate reductase
VPGRVFITQPIPEPGPSLLRPVAGTVTANPDDRLLTRDELCAAVAGCDAVVCLLTDAIDATVLEEAAARGVRVFANMAVGFDNVDVATASRLGVLVTNTPGVLTEATADLTWALILAVARRVVEGDREMRSGRFRGWGPLYLLGGDVTGRTLGLIGPGRIATAVAERARGFRMPLLYHGRRPSPELEALGARAVGLDALLAEGDFVSLHVPQTAETEHLIGARALALMKPTAYLINTARGGLVDAEALVRALEDGQIAGAALDVHNVEPPPESYPLLAMDNVVLTPHAAFYSEEAVGDLQRRVADAVIQVAAR